MGSGLENISPELVKTYQEEIEKRTSKSTAKRKMSSLRRFFDWAQQEGHIEKHPIPRQEPTFTPIAQETPQVQTEPKQKRKIGKFITPANILRGGIAVALIVLIFLLVGRVKIPIPSRRTPATEQAPEIPTDDNGQPILLSPWTIHARMSLKTKDGTPLTGTQTVGFKLYKDENDTSPLHSFGEKQVAVGADGNTLIQLDGVPTDTFFENEKLYLAAEVGGTELETRLPVSTANVSANLQGYYPEQEAGPNSIPVLSEDGSLLLASEAPAIKAENGNLLVEGNTLTLSTPTASDGDITINPDGSGIAHFVFEGTGQNYLNAQAPNLTSGSLYYGIVANNATGYDLIRLENGTTPVERFSVDAQGDTYVGGSLNVSGNIATNGTERLTSSGQLTNITGYSQSSGNFSITQSAGDALTVKKETSALSDLATLTLKEEGVPNSIYSTLVLKRINGATEAMALYVDEGNATFDGQLRLGRYSSNPTAIGTGSVVYNTTDNKAYIWNGSAWQELGAGSSVSFDAITSGTNTSATMVVGTGASLNYTGSGTINASTLATLTASQFLRSDTSDNYTSGTLSFDVSTTLDINGDLTIADTNISFDGASTTFSTTGALTLDTGTSNTINIATDDDILPSGTSGTNDIGSLSVPFDNIYGVSLFQNGNTVCDDSGNCTTGDEGPWNETGGIVSLDTTSWQVSIGDSTTEHKLEVEGAITGKALVSLWEKGDQDILVASNSAVTPANVFRLTNAGNILTEGSIADLSDSTLLVNDSLQIAGTDFSTTQTTLNVDVANTGTINFGDGTYDLAAVKDQGDYVFWNLKGKSNTGNPGTCAEGDIYYNAFDDTVSVCHSGSTWEQLDNSGASSAWSALTDPAANLSLSMNEYTTTFTWDTAASSAIFDGFTYAITNDASTDGGNQRLVVIANNDDAGSTGTTENLLVLDNKDTNEAVTKALEILSSGGGAITTAIDISDSDIVTALSAGANDLSGTNWSITGSSGNITSSGVLDINGGGTSDIAGTLRLSGNNLQASDDLVINALGASGQVEFADGDTLNVGGLTDVTYNAFADATDAPEEAAISTDNDLYIGGDLEVDGTIYGSGSGSIGGFTEGSVIFANSSGTLTEDNTNFYWDDSANKLGIGRTPVGKLDVNGAVTGKALVILDETGDQAILTASASGTTVMTLGRTGNLQLTNSGTSNIDFNLSSTGDFTISDAGTPFATFTDAGVFTLDSLNFDGTTIGLTTDTDLLSLASEALTVNGDLRLANTYTLEVGGLTGVSYNAFADPGDAADEAAIAADNDLYIGGDLEVDGTIYDSSGNVVAGYWTLSGSNLYTTSNDYKVGVGTSSPISRLHVATNTSTLTGKSAFIVDQLEAEDIFTASASGVTKLTLTNSGTLQLFNASSTLSNTSGDITIDAASNTISFAGDDLTNLGYVLASDQVHVGNFASNPTNIGEGSIYYNTTDDKLYYYTAAGWTEIGSGSGGFWSHVDHAVYPTDYWADDVLVGGNSTASAKFRIVSTTGNIDTSNNTIDWTLNNAVDALNIDSNTLSIDALNNRVGIGITTPVAPLTVNNSTAGILSVGDTNTRFGAQISGDDSGIGLFGSNLYVDGSNNLKTFGTHGSYGYTGIEASWGDLYFYAESGATTQDATVTPTAKMVILDTGNVGIGNTNPTTALHVGTASETHGLSTGDVLISSDLELDGVLYLDGGTISNVAGTGTIIFTATPTTNANSLSASSWLVENTANVGWAALLVNQTKAGDLFTASASGVTKFTIQNDGDVVFGDASGTDLTVGGGSGKIDVGTVDPVYNINGTKYATYMAGMIGVKEEVTGIVNTSTYVPGSGYKTTIDFKNQQKGSDLWLFSKATDLQKHIEEMVVLLSSSGNNTAWYRVDPNNYTLSIYTSRPTSVSYRLTAPRFDAALWTNYNDNEESIGFILDDNPLTINGEGDVNQAEENYVAGIDIIESQEQSDFFDSIDLPVFEIKDSAGNIIHKVDAFSKFVAANIKAGAIEVNDIAVKGTAYVAETIKAGAIETANVTTQSLIAFQGTIDNLLITAGLVSPYIETSVISPIADSDIRVNLDNSENQDGSSFGEFVIEGQNDEEVASIDSLGNATFSGTVESDEVKTNDLTAGKIYADEIIARTGVFADLKAATSSAVTREEIEELLRAVEEDQRLLAQSSSWNTSVATDSADLNTIATSDLYVTSQAAINSLSVSESFVIGSDFSIQTTQDEFGGYIATSINTLSAPLQIQSLGLAPVEIMAGLVRVETNGDVYIEENLYVAGQIESSGLTLKEKEPEEGESKLSELLRLQNLDGNTVASIDASGSAYFDKLVLAGSEATTSASLLEGLVTQTNATAGEGLIPQGTREITIRSPKITSYTLVYVTPTSSTENNVLYVKEKGEGYFVVGFNKALDIDVSFNWWVIDVRQINE